MPSRDDDIETMPEGDLLTIPSGNIEAPLDEKEESGPMTGAAKDSVAPSAPKALKSWDGPWTAFSRVVAS